MASTDCRDRIVAAWEKLTRKNNPDKITIRNITQECSISRQMFYYYFRDMRDVLSYAMIRGNQHTLDRLSTAATLSEGLQDYLEDFLRYYAVTKSFRDSSYRDEYEEMLVQNSREVISLLLSRFYPNSPRNDPMINTLLDLLSSGMAGMILHLRRKEDLDIPVLCANIAQLLERTLTS